MCVHAPSAKPSSRLVLQVVVLLTVAALAGCAYSHYKRPVPTGEPVPVYPQADPAATPEAELYEPYGLYDPQDGLDETPEVETATASVTDDGLTSDTPPAGDDPKDDPLIDAPAPAGDETHLTGQPLTKADLVAMVTAGVGEETMLMLIESSRIAFDVTAGAVIVLHEAGISDRVMASIIERWRMQNQ